MGKKHIFQGPIDLQKYELLNARLQNLFILPPDPFEGQVIYRSDIKLGAFYNGTEWLYFGFTEENYQAILELLENPFSRNHSDLNLDDGTNPHGTTKGDVGLGNVDNTSDLDKPISIPAQAALDLKADTSDLEPVSFYYPLVWLMDGVSTALPIPDGGSEDWLLSKVNGAFMGVSNVVMAFEFYPDEKEIRVKDGYFFESGQKIVFDLIFIYS